MTKVLLALVATLIPLSANARGTGHAVYTPKAAHNTVKPAASAKFAGGVFYDAHAVTTGYYPRGVR